MATKKKVWAEAIGRLILATNEIDQLLHTIRGAYFELAFGSNWMRGAFSDRLEMIGDCVARREPSVFIDRLRTLIARAQALVSIRNHVAHGTFVLDADVIAERDLPLNEFSLMRYNPKEKAMNVVTFQEILDAAREAMSLSDDFSRLLSTSHDFRIRRMPNGTENYQ